MDVDVIVNSGNAIGYITMHPFSFIKSGRCITTLDPVLLLLKLSIELISPWNLDKLKE